LFGAAGTKIEHKSVGINEINVSTDTSFLETSLSEGILLINSEVTFKERASGTPP
jgi:hypothetical protein